MTIGLTYDEMRALRPCPDRSAAATRKLGGRKGWDGRRVTVREAKDAGISMYDVLWVAEKMARKDTDVERRLGLWIADCAARVLFIYEKYAPHDARVRDAITARRRFARGEIETAALNAALNSAGAAAWDAARDARASGVAAWAARAAWAAAWAARDAGDARDARDAWAAAEAARDAAGAARDAAGDAGAARDARAAWAAARDAWAAETEWQYEQLAARLSDPEPDDWPLPPQPANDLMGAAS